MGRDPASWQGLTGDKIHQLGVIRFNVVTRQHVEIPFAKGAVRTSAPRFLPRNIPIGRGRPDIRPRQAPDRPKSLLFLRFSDVRPVFATTACGLRPSGDRTVSTRRRFGAIAFAIHPSCFGLKRRYLQRVLRTLLGDSASGLI